MVTADGDGNDRVDCHLFREYAPFKGEIEGRNRGVMISMEPGTSTAYALNNIQARGKLFVGPQEEIYTGMIVGENARPEDLPVNPCKAKHLTNMRSQGEGKGIQLEAPLKMSLERAIEYIDSDEFVEATPKSLRLRKRILNATARKRAAAVTFYRIDTSSQPERFVSGIDVDPANPNHAFVTYSGYNVYATAAGTATGHIFEVTYNPTTHAATWSGDLASNLGDQPITGIAVDWQTKTSYVSTDFGVFARRSGKTNWQKGGNGLPPVAVYGLSMNVGARVLYAATHGRSAWMLNLQ